MSDMGWCSHIRSIEAANLAACEYMRKKKGLSTDIDLESIDCEEECPCYKECMMNEVENHANV